MPTLRRTPNNPDGEYVDDAFDASDARNVGVQQNNALMQMALAKLKEQQYEYGQNRTDAMGMFQTAMQNNNHQVDRQFDYFSGRDKLANQRYEEERSFATDPSRNPSLQMQMTQSAALQRLLEMQGKQGERTEKAAERTDAAANTPPDFSGWNKQDIDAYTAGVGAGSTPAQGVAAHNVALQQRAQDEAKTVSDALGSDLKTFSNRDNAPVGWDPSDTDVSVLNSRLESLRQMLVKKLNLPDVEAKAKVDQLVRDNTAHSLNSGYVDTLRNQRGIPY